MEKGWKREGNYIEVGRKHEVRREETRRKQRRHNTIQMEAGRKTGLAVVSGKLGGVGGADRGLCQRETSLQQQSKAVTTHHISPLEEERRHGEGWSEGDTEREEENGVHHGEFQLDIVSSHLFCCAAATSFGEP